MEAAGAAVEAIHLPPHKAARLAPWILPGLPEKLGILGWNPGNQWRGTLGWGPFLGILGSQAAQPLMNRHQWALCIGPMTLLSPFS